MHFTLFNLAGFAILAWLLLILLPTWRVTRWLAESAVFPIYLCILYAVGIAVILVESGLGLMAEFGSAEGVLRILSRPDVALIAWIHILAFDQFVGLYIYRDNIRHRYLPIPLQSVLLILTLMLGPLGLLTYYIVRGARRAARAEPILRAVDPFPDLAAPAPTPPAEIMAAFGTAADSELDNRIASLPSPLLSPVRYMLAVFGREERALCRVEARAASAPS